MSKLGKEGHKCHFGIVLSGKRQTINSDLLQNCKTKGKNVLGGKEFTESLEMSFQV